MSTAVENGLNRRPHVPPLHPKKPLATILVTLAWLTFAGVIWWSFCAVEFNAGKLVDGVPNMVRFIQDAFPPD